MGMILKKRRSSAHLWAMSFLPSVVPLIWPGPAALAQPVDPAPVVAVAQGALEGRAANGVATFFGIPFAAPPVGENRWRNPQPPAPWQGKREAAAYGPACAQNDPSFGGIFDRSSREDCLYLNVWTPDRKPAHRLPVLVYIHGGALVGGAGSIPLFDGAEFARQGVILVTINYRLGIFGFLSHPGLTAESPDRASGNYGLADQIAALRWVRHNIAAFGGDPRRVTLSGQSAGSASVLMLMTSPKARGLFSGAIAESGTPLLSPWMSRDAAEQMGREFATSLGAESVAKLRAKSPDELMTPWRQFLAARGIGLMRMVVDGAVLDQSSSHAFASHREASLPLLIGNNSREGINVPAPADWPAALVRTYGASAEKAQAIYGGTESDAVLGSPAERFATDISFRCPAVVIARWHAKRGAPVYSYQFEEPLPAHAAMGAQHSDEVAFTFSTLRMMTFGKPLPAGAQELSKTMAGYWANFAKRHNPNGPGLPKWPAYKPGTARFVHLSSAGVRVDSKLEDNACRLYETSVVPALATPITATVHQSK